MADAKIEEIKDEEDDEKTTKISLPWYMVNGDGGSMQSWDLFITFITIYSMFVTPFIMVFPEVYAIYNEDT